LATKIVIPETVITKESIIKKTYASENLPPAFAEAASRRQVAPLCQIPPNAGLPFAAGPRGPLARRVKGGKEGFSLRCPYNYGLINKRLNEPPKEIRIKFWEQIEKLIKILLIRV